MPKSTQICILHFYKFNTISLILTQSYDIVSITYCVSDVLSSEGSIINSCTNIATVSVRLTDVVKKKTTPAWRFNVLPSEQCPFGALKVISKQFCFNKTFYNNKLRINNHGVVWLHCIANNYAVIGVNKQSDCGKVYGTNSDIICHPRGC